MSRHCYPRTVDCNVWGIYLAVPMILCALAMAGEAAPRRDCFYVRRFVSLSFQNQPELGDNCCKWPKSIIKCHMSSVLEIDFTSRDMTGGVRGNMIRHLKNLTRLDLSDNSLSGNIPSEIWDLPNLQYLNLSWNNFDGKLSVNRSTATLETVDLSHNSLVGNFLVLCTYFRNLSSLNVSFNYFMKLDRMLSKCNSLQTLQASSNQLRGEIPTDISQVRKLTGLLISHNQLNGSIPELNNLTDLQVLDLSFNNLSGWFPQHFVQLLPTLRKLNVSSNDLEGSVDSETWIKFGATAFQNTDLSENKEGSSPAPTPSQMIRVLAPLSKAPVHMAASRMGAGTIVGIAVGTFVGFITISLTLIICKRRRKMKWEIKKPPIPSTTDKQFPDMGPFSFTADSGSWVANVKDPNSVPVLIFEKPLLNLTFADLLRVTSSFDKVAEIGDDSSLVYKCVLPGVLPGDVEVAIKVLVEGRVLKDQEAAAKFDAIGKIKHENIVPLLGYCIVGDERLLIYKFMQNGTLHDRLHALPEGNMSTEDWNMDVWEENEATNELQGESISWATRYKVALGIARALAFLHHGWSSQIVHKAISSTNILLDEHFEPRLAGCGLGDFSLIICGQKTDGYIPPEYAHSWNPTTRGDVYSFGVVVLELVTGRRPAGDYFPYHRCNNVVSWVRYVMKEKQAAMRALDPKLVRSRSEGAHVRDEMVETLRIGYLCTADSPSKRPTMQQVVGLLKDITATTTTTTTTTTLAPAPLTN